MPVPHLLVPLGLGAAGLGVAYLLLRKKHPALAAAAPSYTPAAYTPPARVQPSTPAPVPAVPGGWEPGQIYVGPDLPGGVPRATQLLPDEPLYQPAGEYPSPASDDPAGQYPEPGGSPYQPVVDYQPAGPGYQEEPEEPGLLSGLFGGDDDDVSGVVFGATDPVARRRRARARKLKDWLG